MITVYLDTQDSILLRSKDVSFHILYYIMQQTNMEDCTWYADSTNKQLIMDKVGLAKVSLDKHLTSLKERNLILSTSRGKYKLNMEIFTI
jgi:hypothetical protein